MKSRVLPVRETLDGDNIAAVDGAVGGPFRFVK